MMRASLVIALACLGCRGGPTAVRYAGPPVGQCSSGRAYTPPPEASNPEHKPEAAR